MSTLKLEESTSILCKYFQVLALEKLKFRIHSNTQLQTLPGCPSPRALKRIDGGLPFQKLLDLEMPVKSSVLYFDYYFKYKQGPWGLQTKADFDDDNMYLGYQNCTQKVFLSVANVACAL